MDQLARVDNMRGLERTRAQSGQPTLHVRGLLVYLQENVPDHFCFTFQFIFFHWKIKFNYKQRLPATFSTFLKSKMRAFIITMPERLERVERLIKELEAFGIRGVAIQAVDARQPRELAELFRKLHPNVAFSLGTPRVNHSVIGTPGGIGCYASHVKAW